MKPKMKSHYRGHKMAVWLNLIPQLHRPGDDDVSMRHHHFRERGDHFYAGKKPKASSSNNLNFKKIHFVLDSREVYTIYQLS